MLFQPMSLFTRVEFMRNVLAWPIDFTLPTIHKSPRHSLRMLRAIFTFVASHNPDHVDRPRWSTPGPCGDPLPDTIHLLYKSNRPGTFAALSIFVQSYHNQYPLSLDQIYTASDARDPFPMLVWRTEKVVYFLLADDEQTEHRAASAIAAAPKDSQ